MKLEPMGVNSLVPVTRSAVGTAAAVVSAAKREFSDAISLSMKLGSTGVSADARGANVNAAPTAKPPTTAILRKFIVEPFNDFRRRPGRNRRRSPLRAWAGT